MANIQVIKLNPDYYCDWAGEIALLGAKFGWVDGGLDINTIGNAI